MTYGTGSVSGLLCQDDVSVAGLKLNALQFGVANQESHDFTGATFDCLMGLAQSTLSEQKNPTSVEALAKQGLIQEAIVSYKLSRVSDKKNDGEITLGGKDPSKFDPKTVATMPNVNTNGFWEATVEATSLDGNDLAFKGRTAILDTGTTLMVMPKTDATSIHKLIPGSKSDRNGGFTIPCTTNASLEFTFGGKPFPVQASDLLFLPVDPNDLTGDCQSGISGGDIGGPTQWLLGAAFLKNAYFTTDVGKNSIDLAQFK